MALEDNAAYRECQMVGRVALARAGGVLALAGAGRGVSASAKADAGSP